MPPPSATRRILLHVGSPKCGSTYLQQALRQSAEALCAAGIHYPHDGGDHPGNAGALERIDRAGLDALFAPGIHTLILSHEDLFGLPRRGDALAALTREDGTAVTVLAFLRPFSEFVFGDYSQFMKQHFERYLETRRPYEGRSFEAFAERRAETLRPAAFLSGWQKRFGPGTLELGSHRTIRPVLGRLLGVAAPIDWQVPREAANPSLRMADCERLARALANPSIPAETLLAMYRAAHHSAGHDDPGRSPDRVAWLERLFAPQNDALAERFGFDNRAAPVAAAGP